jgi:hypothetical protein
MRRGNRDNFFGPLIVLEIPILIVPDPFAQSCIISHFQNEYRTDMSIDRTLYVVNGRSFFLDRKALCCAISRRTLVPIRHRNHYIFDIFRGKIRKPARFGVGVSQIQAPLQDGDGKHTSTAYGIVPLASFGTIPPFPRTCEHTQQIASAAEFPSDRDLFLLDGFAVAIDVSPRHDMQVYTISQGVSSSALVPLINNFAMGCPQVSQYASRTSITFLIFVLFEPVAGAMAGNGCGEGLGSLDASCDRGGERTGVGI